VCPLDTSSPQLLTPPCLQGGIYCCYDAFSCVDVRFDVSCTDGSVACYTVDAEGTAGDVPADDAPSHPAWLGARVSAALRSMRAHPLVALRAGCLHRRGVLPSSLAHEVQLLDALLTLRALPDSGRAVQALARRLNPDNAVVWERTALPDVALDVLCSYFTATRRPDAGAAFFTRIMDAPPVPGVPHPATALAAALASQARWEEARGVLVTALAAAPTDPLLLLWLVKTRVGSGDAQGAVEAARRAVAAAPGLRAAWLLLAAALARAEHWAAALVALNCAPEVEAAEEEAADVWLASFPAGLPRPARTCGQSVPDPAVEEEALSAEEHATLDGRRRLVALPGASLVAPPHALYYALGGRDGPPPASPGVRACSACYDVLVDATTALGWDALLELRGTVFVLDADDAAPGAAQPGAAQGEDALRAASAPSREEAKGGGTPQVAPGPIAHRAVDSGGAAACDERQLALDAALLAGDAPLEEVLEERRLCAPWLDAVFGALYADVAEYTDWRTAEAVEARRASGQATAADAAADTDSALGTRGDWLRRGAMCERLKRVDDAERAYRVCVHLGGGGFNATAWRGLARIYAAWGWAPEALTACAQLAAGLAGCEHPAADVAVPPSVAQALRTLIAALGLQAVRDAQHSLGEPSAVVNACFHAAVHWRMDGWDR
jgi:tetratricopeptide (TPR) repeat protein